MPRGDPAASIFLYRYLPPFSYWGLFELRRSQLDDKDVSNSVWVGWLVATP
jgi:hypothetical protein